MLKSFLLEKTKDQILKNNPDGAFNVVLNRLYRLLKDCSEGAIRELYSNVVYILEHSGNVRDALGVMERYISSIPQGMLASIRKDLYDISKDLYKIGFNLVRVENKGIDIAFNLTDISAINAIGNHNIFWVGESFKELGVQINDIVKEFYEQNLTRIELAERLRDRLGVQIKELEGYYEGLADHIAVKTKELGRISGYQRAGIRYIKVKAILDERTSKICRHMHGRIISVERLAEQKERILSAQSKEDLKSAQRWISEFTGRTKDLPDGVAGPPYHYRCRTTTVAYFEELSGEPAGDETYQYYDGRTTRKEKVLFKHYDKELGRELVLTEDKVRHMLANWHNIKDLEKIKSSMRSIKRWGVSSHPDSLGQLAGLSENGVYIVFRDNVVYNMFMDERGKRATERYFRKWTEVEGFRKWVELLKQYFTDLLTK